MISSGELPQRGLDTMLVVYLLLKRHPAQTTCKEFLQSRRGWFVAAPALRLIAQWEEAHLPAKGLPRVLHTVGRWLDGQLPALAESFHSATGGYSHLP